MKRVRGTCPVCQRELALRADRSLPDHNMRAVLLARMEPERCAGSGLQPVDQPPLFPEAA